MEDEEVPWACGGGRGGWVLCYNLAIAGEQSEVEALRGCSHTCLTATTRDGRCFLLTQKAIEGSQKIWSERNWIGVLFCFVFNFVTTCPLDFYASML